MAISEIVSTDVIIDLDDPPTGHRLTELLQALTGAAWRRRAAISDPTPRAASPDEALTSSLGHGGRQAAESAPALVRRSRSRTVRALPGGVADSSSPIFSITPPFRGTSSASQRASISSSGSPST